MTDFEIGFIVIYFTIILVFFVWYVSRINSIKRDVEDIKKVIRENYGDKQQYRFNKQAVGSDNDVDIK